MVQSLSAFVTVMVFKMFDIDCDINYCLISLLSNGQFIADLINPSLKFKRCSLLV